MFVHSQNFAEVADSSVKQEFSFFFDSTTDKWLGSVTLWFNDKSKKTYELKTTRKARKTWSSLEGCIKYAKEICPQAEIKFTFNHPNGSISFQHIPNK